MRYPWHQKCFTKLHSNGKQAQLERAISGSKLRKFFVPKIFFFENSFSKKKFFQKIFFRKYFCRKKIFWSKFFRCVIFFWNDIIHTNPVMQRLGEFRHPQSCFLTLAGELWESYIYHLSSGRTQFERVVSGSKSRPSAGDYYLSQKIQSGFEILQEKKETRKARQATRQTTCLWHVQTLIIILEMSHILFIFWNSMLGDPATKGDPAAHPSSISPSLVG